MDSILCSTFSNKIEALMQQWHVPALAIAICEGEKVSTRAYGYTDLNTSRPCTADTLFDIASSSKSLTAASIGLLVADKETYPEVQWDTPVSRLLPEDFVLADQFYTDHVTLEDIISHRSGLPR